MMKIEEDKDEKLKASPLGDDLYKYYYTTTHQRNTNNRAILHQPKTSRVLPTPPRATEHQTQGIRYLPGVIDEIGIRIKNVLSTSNQDQIVPRGVKGDGRETSESCSKQTRRGEVEEKNLLQLVLPRLQNPESERQPRTKKTINLV